MLIPLLFLGCGEKTSTSTAAPASVTPLTHTTASLKLSLIHI